MLSFSNNNGNLPGKDSAFETEGSAARQKISVPPDFLLYKIPAFYHDRDTMSVCRYALFAQMSPVKRRFG